MYRLQQELATPNASVVVHKPRPEWLAISTPAERRSNRIAAIQVLTGDDPSARGIRSWRCRCVVRFAQIIVHPIFCKVPLHGILLFMLAPTLPDLSRLNREALQTLLLAEHQERIAIHQQLLQRESEIERLKLLLSQLRRMQFGRKSEKLERQIEQLELRLEDLQLAQAAEETTETCPAESSPPVANVKPVRHPLPERLPRQTQTHEPKHSAVPTAAESCGSWAKMYRRCWSTSRNAFG